MKVKDKLKLKKIMFEKKAEFLFMSFVVLIHNTGDWYIIHSAPIKFKESNTEKFIMPFNYSDINEKNINNMIKSAEKLFNDINNEK